MDQVERTKFYTDQLPQERPARAGEPIEYASLVAASDVAISASAAQLTTKVHVNHSNRCNNNLTKSQCADQRYFHSLSVVEKTRGQVIFLNRLFA